MELGHKSKFRVGRTSSAHGNAVTSEPAPKHLKVHARTDSTSHASGFNNCSIYMYT
jgi:hypothetical protein